MFFGFKPAYQISALQLNRQGQERCAPCALLCTTAHLFFQTMVYKKVYSSIHTKFQLSSLADKKVRENVHFVHPVHYCTPLCTTAHLFFFFQNMAQKKVYEILIQAFMPNFSSPAQQTKKLVKICTLCASCASLCTPAQCRQRSMILLKLYRSPVELTIKF